MLESNMSILASTAHIYPCPHESDAGSTIAAPFQGINVTHFTLLSPMNTTLEQHFPYK